MMKIRILVPLLIIALLALAGWRWSRVQPSHDRPWAVGQELLPEAVVQRDSVIIRNLRAFSYDSSGNVRTASYRTGAYDLNKLETVWFVLAPFESDNRGPAHSFLTFGFADSQYVAVSVEARKEIGEEYSLVKGLLKQYEIMYVIGEEADLIKLRVARRDDVYLYPIRTTPEKVRKLFVQMLEHANRLRAEPEFYNTLTNNCTTKILEHANRVASRKIPYGREVLLPGYADELAARLGLIDTNLPIDEARRRFHINARAERAFGDDVHFSTRIRQSEDL